MGLSVSWVSLCEKLGVLSKGDLLYIIIENSSRLVVVISREIATTRMILQDQVESYKH